MPDSYSVPNRANRRLWIRDAKLAVRPGFHTPEKQLQARRKRATLRKVKALASRGKRGKRT